MRKPATRMKDPDVLKTGWVNEAEHTKYLTGLSGIKPPTKAALSTQNVTNHVGDLSSSPRGASAGSTASTSTFSSELEVVVMRHLGKIATSLGSLPDIADKLGQVCCHLNVQKEKRKRIYADALAALKKEKHGETKGVVISSDDESDEGSKGEKSDDDDDEDDDFDDDDDDDDDDAGDSSGVRGEVDGVASSFEEDEAKAKERAQLNDAKRKRDRERSKTKAAETRAATKAKKDAEAAAKKSETDAAPAGARLSTLGRPIKQKKTKTAALAKINNKIVKENWNSFLFLVSSFAEHNSIKTRDRNESGTVAGQKTTIDSTTIGIIAYRS